MAQQGVSSLWDKFNTILGLFTGCIGGAFLLGIFTKTANGQGVVLGMIASFFTQLWIQSYTNLHLLMYAFTGLLSCVMLGYIFSLFFSRHKSIEGLTYATLKHK
jgi:Na+/proline symporter